VLINLKQKKMKKIIAVLIAGTFIIGTVAAQTPATATQKPAEKKETMAPQKQAEKKDAMGTKTGGGGGGKKHHKGGKGKGKKAETATPQTK
jgi:hypothetical protein